METTDGHNATLRTSTRMRLNIKQQEVQHNEVLTQDLLVCNSSKEHNSNITGPCVTQLLGNLVPVYVWIFKLCGEMAQNLRNRRSNDCVRMETTDGQNATSRINTRTRIENTQQKVQHNEVLTRDLIEKKQQKVQHYGTQTRDSLVGNSGGNHTSTITGSCVTQLLGNYVSVYVWIFKL